MIRFFSILALCLALAYGQAASDAKAPKLTATQIQAAIQKGQEYKSPDKFFDKGLRGRRVEPTRYTTITFFNDWQTVALASAEAKFEMRELKVDDVHTSGLLHAYVQTKLTIGAVHWLDIRDSDASVRRSNLVLMIEGKTVQPVGRRVVSNQGATVTLAFDFDVSPQDLLNPVMVVSVDGDDGHKHQKKADLAGILDVD
jgi:hypothetical protein